MATVTISKEHARGLSHATLREEDHMGCYVVERQIIDRRRWETIHKLVFSLGGVSWMFTYRNPATEEVEPTWWQEAPEEIVCTEVHEILTTTFVPVESQEQRSAQAWANDAVNVLEEADRYDLADQLRRWILL